jgi:hypothetical protein
MRALFLDLLQHQGRLGYPDFAGTDAQAVIPITDRVLNEIIAKILPADGAVREVALRAEEGDRLAIKVTLARPSFLPPIPVTLLVHEQPELPHKPVLILKLSLARAVMGLALRALSAAKLPPGISIVDETIQVDIRRMLAEHKMDEILQYVTELRVHTRAGVVVVSLRAQVGAA